MIPEASSDALIPPTNPTPPPTPPTANLQTDSFNSSSFPLDPASWEHVEKLCSQLLSCSKVNEAVYKVPLLDALRSFATYLTPELLSRLARSKGAQARAAIELDEVRGGANGASDGRQNDGVWWTSTGRLPGEGGETEKAEIEKERKREIWRNAAMLLSTPEDDDSETADGLRTHQHDVSTISTADPDQDEAWLEVDAMSKTPVLSILLETNETTMAAVNNNEATLGVMFEADRYEGKNLFGRSQHELDKEDLELVDRLGGSFRLTTTKKNLPRLERIIEFLAFSVVTLLLEAQLLSDLSCPRPLPNSLNPSSPLLEAAINLADLEAEEAGNSSLINLKLPGAYEPDFDEEEPDDDWGYTRRSRSWRSSFSNNGVLAWMRLANHPRAQLLSPVKSERSLRRSSTITSERHSSRTEPLADSAPNSPSPSPSAKRGKVANKLRGIRDQLRGKIGRSDSKSISRDGSDDENEVPVKRGANVGMVGLQIAGVNHKGSWSLPWSSAEFKEEEVHVEELKDSASTAGAEVTVEGDKPPPKRFEKVIEDLSNFILSTSPDVCYPPPHLLMSLREKELAASSNSPSVTPLQMPSTPPSPSLSTPYVLADLYDTNPPFPNTTRSVFLNPRTSALQRAHALPSSHSLALNFAGGQEHEPEKLMMPEERRTTSTSTATRIALDARAGLASLMTNNSSLGGTIRHQAMQFLVQTVLADPTIRTSSCEPYQWLTFHYFEDSKQDQGVGVDSTLEGFVRRIIGDQEAKCNHCDRPNKEHTIVLLHHNEKIEISVSSLESVNPQPDLHESAPSSSRILQWHTCNICQAITATTTLSPTSSSYSFAKFLELLLYDSNLIPVPELCKHAAKERTALVRSFSLERSVVQVKRSSVSLYELRLPTAIDPDVLPDNGDDLQATAEDSLEMLRDEIDSFFRSSRACTKSLRHRLTTFPPSPPESPERHLAISSQEPFAATPQHVRSDSEQTIVDISTRPEVPSISQVVEEDVPTSSETELLRKLDQFIDKEEKACRDTVNELAPGKLNLGRSAFEVKAKALKRRMSAWELKHSETLKSVSESTPPPFDEPSYFSGTVLALPLASSVLLRTDELSSLLAVTLSTDEFKEECQTTSAASSRRVTPSTPNFLPKSRQSSVRLPIPTFAAFVDSTIPLDPDDPYADYSSPTHFEVIAKRKKPPRSSGSMFRNLVRKKSGEISSPSTPTSEHSGFTLDSKRRTVKDSVLNDFLKTKDLPPTLPRSARAVPSIISGIASRREASSIAGPSLTEDVLAQFSLEVGSAAGTIRSKITPTCSTSGTPTDSSASSVVDFDKQSINENDKQSLGEKETPHDEDEEDSLAPLAADLGSNSSRLLDGIRSGFDSLRSRAGGASPRLSGPLSESFGSSEHVKLKVTEGDSKYSVTAYFPRRFKDLRAKCGLTESLFIESLSRCTDLNPSGGKSSAAFLMTGNQRFMLKELVTKYGYSELDSLLTFAPRLLDYQMQADRPSLLSKIFGIYTIKIQDLKTGEKKKRDVIVMDNLFHSQTISRQFDLKGIASRVAKAKPGEETKEDGTSGVAGEGPERSTGWDSDWLEGSVRDQLLLYPHSRTLLLDAVSNDVEFLSSNGNIDFSLLVGVDDKANTLVVGLIDTLGVFNTLKVLEHSAKKGIKMALASDASTVTVCPPSEYAKRFLSSMESYFIASPDRWSKAPGSTEDSDPRLACPL